MTQLPIMILNGGQATRLGKTDKALVPLAGKPLLAHVLERLHGQGAPIALGSMQPSEQYDAFELPVIADRNFVGMGPLAGVYSALLWAKGLGFDRVVTVAADTPFLPRNLVENLKEGGTTTYAQSNGRAHPISALWPTSLLADVEKALTCGENKMQLFLKDIGAHSVHFDTRPVDPFFNINTQADLDEAAQLFAKLST